MYSPDSPYHLHSHHIFSNILHVRLCQSHSGLAQDDSLQLSTASARLEDRWGSGNSVSRKIYHDGEDGDCSFSKLERATAIARTLSPSLPSDDCCPSLASSSRCAQIWTKLRANMSPQTWTLEILMYGGDGDGCDQIGIDQLSHQRCLYNHAQTSDSHTVNSPDPTISRPPYHQQR